MRLRLDILVRPAATVLEMQTGGLGTVQDLIRDVFKASTH